MSHSHSHGHTHSHGLVDESIKRSHAGVRAVALALLVLGLTAAAQAAIFALSGSVALLADLIHNAGDAATAIPLGIAFALRSERAERWAGLAVVLAIGISACVAGFEAVHQQYEMQRVQDMLTTSVVDAVDGSSTGTRVPRMWALLGLPRFRGAGHAYGYDNRSRYRQVSFPSPRS